MLRQQRLLKAARLQNNIMIGKTVFPEVQP